MKRFLLLLLCASAVFAQTEAPAQGQDPQATAAQAELEKLRMQMFRIQKTLTDWANLTRYRQENADLVAKGLDPNGVVFMGDSITDAWGRTLSVGKFFPGKPYVNRGISGQTTPQMLIRFRPDVIALKPKVVVILAGTNDIAGNTGPMTLEETEGNLMSMAELAKASGIQVVLSSVMPTSDYLHKQTDRRPNEKIIEVNKWMEGYAKQNGFVYLDYYTALLDDQKVFKKELTVDGLHPNDAGYAVMAPLAQKAIDAALAHP
jgi:lysophospholipase L1-like esterase